MPRKIENLVGNRYGKLVVVEQSDFYYSPDGKQRIAMWKCKCDCGGERIVSGVNLRNGKAKDCKCSDSAERDKDGKFQKGNGVHDLTGQRFGKLTVLYLDKIVGKRSYWKVKCDCGNVKSVRGDTLKKIVSCGCVKKEQDIKNLGISNNHELTYHPVYGIWNAMKSRCENPNSFAYKDYGGRGIKICKEWHDIRNFAKWADETGFIPNKDLSIERIDVNGNYCPENCCWISRKLQTRNRRNTVKIDIDGVEKPLGEWCELFGVPYKRVFGRMQNGITDVEDLFYKGNLQMRKLGREVV